MSAHVSQQGPLTPSEARQLSQHLKRFHETFQGVTFNQLKGLLFSIGCSPTPIFPESWLPLVFGTSWAPKQNLPDQDAMLLDAIFRLQQQIDSDLAKGSPKLPAHARLSPHVKDNFKMGSVLHEWSSGVALGLTLTEQQWHDAELEGTEIWFELQIFWATMTFFADEQQARELRVADGLTPPFGKVVIMIREQLPWIIKDYARLSQIIFEAGYPDDDMIPLSTKPGCAAQPAMNDDTMDD